MGGPPVPCIPSVNLLNSFSAGFAASIVLTPTHSALSASKQHESPKCFHAKVEEKQLNPREGKMRKKKSQNEARVSMVIQGAGFVTRVIELLLKWQRALCKRPQWASPTDDVILDTHALAGLLVSKITSTCSRETGHPAQWPQGNEANL